ncbi:uncharacterized protein LOC131595945 [Vicia villosa]|uniref:uncharacterized protein LOC131595945 n=1 Tax=Vicia villosa TaxID=3911 RepID=UPI00273C7332|nr:uncharacterized protein LOC131595945 [Vicia villosa]
MAGRGRGGRPGGIRYTKPEPYVLFPENINLPEVKLGENSTSMKQLIKWDLSFDSYYKAAPYLLDDTELKGRKRMHIERFSDKKKTTFTRDSLSQVLYFDGFVKELVPGKSKQMPSRKKFRWNPEADAKKLAFFEELEKKFLAEEGKDQKKKKEESEDEEENEEGKESEDDFNDGDYNQNVDYDDDDDDFNDVEAGNDEDVY